jgi:peptidoglycan/xylan/chitin deacetylase (PgdA/CDA1 family)
MFTESTFAVHVDCDNLWIYETEYGSSRSDDQDLIYTQALPSMMDVFARWNIRATFFVIGGELQRKSCVEFCRSALAAGHRIANHSHSHRPDFAALTSAQKREDILAAHSAIVEGSVR